MNPLRLAVSPLLVARQALGDLAAIAEFARGAGSLQDDLLDRADRLLAATAELHALGVGASANAARLIEVGEANVVVGEEMRDLARANIDGNRETNAAMSALDDRMTELLRFTAALERDLPALRNLGDAAPPVQAAAERMERIASRIPGARSSG